MTTTVEMMNARAQTFVQELKLQKMMSSLDLTDHTKSFPTVKMFETSKSVNMFPAFKCRRERTIADISSSKSNPEKDSLSSKLEMAKAEQRKRTKSVFAVSGSRISKKSKEPQYRPQKVWSLHLSRTLPNITQCFTPLPPKTPNKTLALKREMQERKVTLAEHSVSLNIPLTAPNKNRRVLPKTPPNSNRDVQRSNARPHRSNKKFQPIEMSMPLMIPVITDKSAENKNEGVKSADPKNEIARSCQSSEADWVKIPATLSGSLDKTTMTDDKLKSMSPLDAPNQDTFFTNPSDSDIMSTQSGGRSIASRGGPRPGRVLPDVPRLRYTKKDDMSESSRLTTSGTATESLPLLPKSRELTSQSGRRSGPGFPKRPRPMPFKVPNSVFLESVKDHEQV